tara:strand:+ start:284 stop:550 length:267 start_codon:yes stop_codon:yes gene_type:complete
MRKTVNPKMNLQLTQKQIEAVLWSTFDSLATCGEESKYRELTIGIKKLLRQAFPFYSERYEFLEGFLDEYIITGDKRKDWLIFEKYIK